MMSFPSLSELTSLPIPLLDGWETGKRETWGVRVVNLKAQLWEPQQKTVLACARGRDE